MSNITNVETIIRDYWTQLDAVRQSAAENDGEWTLDDVTQMEDMAQDVIHSIAAALGIKPEGKSSFGVVNLNLDPDHPEYPGAEASEEIKLRADSITEDPDVDSGAPENQALVETLKTIADDIVWPVAHGSTILVRPA